MGCDLVLGSPNAQVAPKRVRHLWAQASNLTLCAPVGGGVQANTQTLHLTLREQIADDLRSTAAAEAQVGSGAVVPG